MTIFEKIAKGELPCHRVWEDEEFLAFLDIRPVSKGHCLVIPKEPFDPVFSMPEEKYSRYWLVAKYVAELLKAKLECERVCMAVVGFEVPHAHIHLIPANSMSDFPWPGGREASENELAELAELIRS